MSMAALDEAGRRAAIVADVRTWIGTPYHHLGDVKGVGVDCAMLLVRVFADLGLIPDIDPRPYSPQWHQNRSEESYLAWLEQYASVVAEPLPGDVAVWRWRDDRPFSHGAVLIDGDGHSGMVVHALRMAREVCMQRVNEAPLAGRQVRWYRMNLINAEGGL